MHYFSLWTRVQIKGLKMNRIRFKDYLISRFSQLFGTRNIKRWQGTFSSDFGLLWWLGHVCDVYELVDLFCSCGVVVLQSLVSHWATLISPNYFLLHSVFLFLVVVSATFRRIWHCRRVLRTPLCQFLWQSDTGDENMIFLDFVQNHSRKVPEAR